MIRSLIRARRACALVATTTSLSLVTTASAFAAGSSMPWEAPLESILQSIEGPVAKIVAVIIIIVTGLTLAPHGIISNNMRAPDIPGEFAMSNRAVLADPR